MCVRLCVNCALLIRKKDFGETARERRSARLRHFFHAITGAKYVGEKKEETREARKGHVEKKKEKEKISCCLHHFNFFRLLYQPSFYSIMVRHFESRLAIQVGESHLL